MITVAAVLLSALLTALVVGGHSSAGTLDPDSPSPDGGMALASLMRERGFSVVAVHTTADATAAITAAGPGGSTVLVTDPELLTPGQLADLTAGPEGRLVLVRPDIFTLDTLGTSVYSNGPGYAPPSSTALDPACSDGDATAAGRADLGDGEDFEGPAGCYPLRRGSALVTLPGPGSGDTVLVGSRSPFRNDKLDSDGNAALTMRLLGKHPTIVWYLPDTADPAAAADTQQKSLWQVVPSGWRWGTLMLFIALVFLALWQSRRLGPVSVEKMPVVIRAAEAVEGRARLYERGQVRGGAADALRGATLNRLAARLGLAHGASAEDVAAAVVVRGGRPAPETVALLRPGTEPGDDKQLVLLAAALDALEAEVGRL